MLKSTIGIVGENADDMTLLKKKKHKVNWRIIDMLY